MKKTDTSMVNKFAALTPPFPLGSHEPRFNPRIVRRALNEKCSTFPGALPVRATRTREGSPQVEQRADERRANIGLSGRFGGPRED